MLSDSFFQTSDHDMHGPTQLHAGRLDTKRTHRVDIPFDKDYTVAHVQQLHKFYFLQMLPRLADDLAEKKIHLCPKYLVSGHTQFN